MGIRNQGASLGAVVSVVPGAAGLAVGAGGGEAAAPCGAVGPVLPGLAVRCDEGVVIAGIGSAVGLGDPQIGEEQGPGLDFMREPLSACRVSGPGPML